MDSSWRQSRKAIFITIILIIILSILSIKIYPYFNKPATCFDAKQNGDEKGIDCGGSCKMICITDVIPFNVKISKAIPVSDGMYDLLALVENKNKDKDTEDGKIDYTFNVYDRSGSVIKSISGSTTIPLGQTFPVLIQNVSIPISAGNSISNVIFNISDNKTWKSEDSVYSKTFFKVVDTDYKQNYNNITQLKINLKNLSKASFRNIPVYVLLYDSNHNIIATNSSNIKEILGSATKDLVLTWRTPLDIEDPKIEIYPIITPFTYIK